MTLRDAWRHHHREYLIEAFCLGVFMVSACTFGTLLGHPSSPVVRAVPSMMLRGAMLGLAMALTNVALIYSPWGRRSGAQMNPALTLAFLRLGRMPRSDAAFYVAAQFVGAIAGVLLASPVIGSALSEPHVRFVVTEPGANGPLAALAAEVAITFLLMTVVLRASSTPRLAPYTGIFASTLVALYITFEAPISGMSMNPARSLGSAVGANYWHSLWIYFVAPPIGMLLAAEVFQRQGRKAACAKYHHDDRFHCIFCAWRESAADEPKKGENMRELTAQAGHLSR